jgi:2-polyprenyl-3-methyl-5-hydroxy-6-metoxy-1,4-benzoquinol methylase
MEHLAACLACGAPSRSARVVHVRKDDALVRCAGCGLVFANPQYETHELNKLYQLEYYDEHKNFETDYRERDYLANQPLHRTVIKDILKRYPRLGPGRRVLDFGSGVGFFLDACREQGLDVLGIDFSDVASRFAQQRFGLTVLTDPEHALDGLPAQHFDLVTAWAVVEHLRRPREALEKLTRALAPGGVLCLTVPNLRCWRYQLEGGRWFNIKNPTHLSFFSRDGLTQLLRELGYVNVTRPVFWGGRSDFGRAATLAQYAVRWSNLGADLRLYAERPRDIGRA